MTAPETIEEFYKRESMANSSGYGLNNAGSGHFNVFPCDKCQDHAPYTRRDFYKVSLILGTGKLHYADRWIVINRPALLFSNPVIPYSWEPDLNTQQGWFCLFTEDFIHSNEHKETLQDSPLFKIGGNPVFFIDEVQQHEMSSIFTKMINTMESDYSYKFDLLRNYLYLIIHEAMKMQPAERYEQHGNAPKRITNLFMELLERQFPINSPEAALRLKTANDYARSLSVHANHLNRSVKEITGKTTSALISERITREARALLRHTDWNIAEVAYSLGFEYPAYFNQFFKKHTGITPGDVRSKAV